MFEDAVYYPSEFPGGDVFEVNITNLGMVPVNLSAYRLFKDGNGMGSYTLEDYGVLVSNSTVIYVKNGTITAPLFTEEHCNGGFDIGIIDINGSIPPSSFYAYRHIGLDCVFN